jgi:hypothetical protein
MASGRSRRVSRPVAVASVLVVALVGDTGGGLLPTGLVPATSARWQEGLDLADGDLVFRTGRELMSRLILSQGDTPRFSHVGLIVRIGGSAFVVHAVPPEGTAVSGVVLEPLARFASSSVARDFGAYRISGVTAAARARMRDYALRQIGKPFDDAFALSDDRRMYCTELVLKAIAAGGVEIAPTVPSIRVMLLAEPVVPPDHLRRSPLIEPLSRDDLPGAATPATMPAP